MGNKPGDLTVYSSRVCPNNYFYRSFFYKKLTGDCDVYLLAFFYAVQKIGSIGNEEMMFHF